MDRVNDTERDGKRVYGNDLVSSAIITLSSFFPILNPGESLSTTNAVIPRCF